MDATGNSSMSVRYCDINGIINFVRKMHRALNSKTIMLFNDWCSYCNRKCPWSNHIGLKQKSNVFQGVSFSIIRELCDR
jgi:hypothetical protein